MGAFLAYLMCVRQFLTEFRATTISVQARLGAAKKEVY